MATEYPANTVSGESIALFAARLAEESGRRLAVAPSYDGAGGLTSAGIVAAVRDGKLAAGNSFCGALGDLDRTFLLCSLPLVSPREADAVRLLEAARGLYAASFARLKQRLLYAAPFPPSGLWAKKPIASVGDLAGLKLRVYDATGLSVFAAAGAVPANLSFADVMPHLKDGSIEAVLSSGDGGVGRKLWEYLPHFTEVGYARPLTFSTLGSAIYDQLPADLRGAVDRAAATTQAEVWTQLARRVEANYARMKQNGVAITAADKVTPELRAALAKAASGAIAAWKRDVAPEAAALLDRWPS